MNDSISKQLVVDIIEQHKKMVLGESEWNEGIAYGYAMAHRHLADIFKQLPSAQPETKLIAEIKMSKEDVQSAFDETVARIKAESERKKGIWQITDAYPHNIYCSECHKRFAQAHWSVWEDGSLPRNFCPNCGAKMDGEEDDG